MQGFVSVSISVMVAFLDPNVALEAQHVSPSEDGRALLNTLSAPTNTVTARCHVLENATKTSTGRGVSWSQKAK
jgi:hypothetical protein